MNTNASSRPARRWYQLHLVTMVAALFFGASLWAVNFDGRRNVFEWTRRPVQPWWGMAWIGAASPTWSHGWPVQCCERPMSGSDESGTWIANRWAIDDVPLANFHFGWFFFDLIVALVILSGVIYTVENGCRYQTIPTQFSIQSLLAITGCFATFVAIARASDYPWENALVNTASSVVFLGIALTWLAVVDLFFRGISALT